MLATAVAEWYLAQRGLGWVKVCGLRGYGLGKRAFEARDS